MIFSSLRIPLITAAATLALMSLASCSGIKNQYQQKSMFRLTANSHMAQLQAQGTGAGLLVKRFSISPEFESNSFIYRATPTRYGSDFYNNYMVPPARMITNLVMENLYASSLFSPISQNTLADVRYQLWGKVIDLYTDIQDKDHPVAVVTLRLILDKNTGQGFKPVVHKTYGARIPFDDPSPESMVEGLNQGLTQILNEFHLDMGETGLTPDE